MVPVTEGPVMAAAKVWAPCVIFAKHFDSLFNKHKKKSTRYLKKCFKNSRNYSNDEMKLVFSLKKLYPT